MELKIRARWVHLSFTEKELKVLLVQSGPDTFTLPADNGLESSGLSDYRPAMLFAFLGSSREFVGQINRIPVLKFEKHDKYLAFDFYILVKPDKPVNLAGDCKWFSIEDALLLNTEISTVIADTLKKLRQDINYQPIEYHLLPSDFTIPEIQRLYEIILDKELDRANFYRKILNLEILESSGIKRKDTTYKPPVLYSFNQNYFKKTEEGFKNAF